MIHTRPRIAFSSISCPDYTFAQMADAARRYGYDGIELYALEGDRLTIPVLEARLDEARHALSAVNIVSLNSWGTLSSPAPAERILQEHQIARALELAADLGCPLVKTFGGDLPAGTHARNETFDRMAESLWRLADRAGELGVTLVMETHDGFCLGADLAVLLGRVDHPRFAALWDLHHPFRMGEPPEETDRLIGARVAHVHVKDAVRVDVGWRFVPLGTGELPVRTALSHLIAQGYAGYLALDWEKMWHPELEGPERALPYHSAALRDHIELAMTSVVQAQAKEAHSG